MKISSENQIINAIGFQIIWWLSVVYQEATVLIVVAMVVVHILGLKTKRKQQLKFIITLTLVGALADTVFASIGFLKFSPVASSGVEAIPVWLLTLWLGFSCTIHHSMSWVFRSAALAFFVGAVAGPLSYYGAANLSEIELGTPIFVTLLSLGAFWGILFLGLSIALKESALKDSMINESSEQKT